MYRELDGAAYEAEEGRFTLYSRIVLDRRGIVHAALSRLSDGHATSRLGGAVCVAHSAEEGCRLTEELSINEHPWCVLVIGWRQSSEFLLQLGRFGSREACVERVIVELRLRGA